MLKGVVLEFSGMLCSMQTYEDRLYFLEENRIWNSTGTEFGFYFESPGLSEFQIFQDQLCTTECADQECNRKEFKCRDVRNPRDLIKNENFPYSRAKMIGDNYFAVNWENEESYFYIRKAKVKKINKLKTKCYRAANDETRIWAKNIFGKVMCLNSDLSILWEKQFDKKNNTWSVNIPQVFDNHVVFNIGADPSTRKNGEIVALKKDDGSLVWKQVFESEVSNCLLSNDKLYMAQKGNMIIVEPGTGAILINEPSGFKSSTKRASEILLQYNDYLVMVSKDNQAIRLFSKDGREMLQNLDIPGGYEPHEGGPFKVFNNKIYLRLSPVDMCLKGVKEGLLILYMADEKQDPSIEVKKWPVEIDISVHKDPNVGQYYSMEMQATNLQDLLIYGEIAMKELPSIYGSQMWSDERRNKKFKGKIIFSPKGILFDQESKAKITRKAQFVENWCTKFDIFSGDGKNPIKIEVEFNQ
jgi:hypothetical protein